jgi:pectate lyase
VFFGLIAGGTLIKQMKAIQTALRFYCCTYIPLNISIMKTSAIIFILLFSLSAFAQKQAPLPHGTVYGTKPDTTTIQDAAKLEAFMGKKTRISTAVKGRVLNVTKQKGGWFTIDAGNGKVIAAHFKNYGVNIPAELKGKNIIAEGVAAKQFIADDLQHFAGDTVSGKKQHAVKTNAKHKLTFEVKGLMVE